MASTEGQLLVTELLQPGRIQDLFGPTETLDRRQGQRTFQTTYMARAKVCTKGHYTILHLYPFQRFGEGGGSEGCVPVLPGSDRGPCFLQAALTSWQRITYTHTNHTHTHARAHSNKLFERAVQKPCAMSSKFLTCHAVQAKLPPSQTRIPKEPLAIRAKVEIVVRTKDMRSRKPGAKKERNSRFWFLLLSYFEW